MSKTTMNRRIKDRMLADALHSVKADANNSLFDDDRVESWERAMVALQVHAAEVSWAIMKLRELCASERDP